MRGSSTTRNFSAACPLNRIGWDRRDPPPHERSIANPAERGGRCDWGGSKGARRPRVAIAALDPKRRSKGSAISVVGANAEPGFSGSPPITTHRFRWRGPVRSHGWAADVVDNARAPRFGRLVHVGPSCLALTHRPCHLEPPLFRI